VAGRRRRRGVGGPGPGRRVGPAIGRAGPGRQADDHLGIYDPVPRLRPGPHPQRTGEGRMGVGHGQPRPGTLDLVRPEAFQAVAEPEALDPRPRYAGGIGSTEGNRPDSPNSFVMPLDSPNSFVMIAVGHAPRGRPG